MAKKQPLDESIVTVDQTDLFSPTARGNRRYNPDELVQKRGLGIYAKMLNDEQVKAVTEFKCSAILARGVEWYYPSWCKELSDEEKLERINVFQQMIDQMEEVNFDDAMEGVASGFDLGYSVSEKVYGKLDYQGKTFDVVKSILLRDPATFEFEASAGGIVEKITQKIGGKKDIPVDPLKVIRYVHCPKWDYVFGRSDIKAAYRSWYAKDQLIKLWLLYIERFGGGLTIAQQVADKNLSTADKTALISQLASLASGRSLIAPTGVEIEVLFPASSDIHEKAVQYHDLAIAKAVLVPNLLGLSHTGQTGAYSQSETQLKVFGWTLNKNARRLEAVLNQQLFRDVGDRNWADGVYPRMRFKKATAEHIKFLVEQFVALVNGKAILPTESDEKMLREALELPVRDEKSVLLTDPEEEANKIVEGMRQQDAVDNAVKDAEKSKQETAKEIDAKKLSREESTALVKTIIDGFNKLAELGPPKMVINNSISPSAAVVGQPPHKSDVHPDGEVVSHGRLKYANEEQFRSAVHRVAFAVIERNSEDSIAAGVIRLSDIVARATARALGDDSELALLVDADVSDIATVTLNGSDIAKLKSASSELLGQGWRIGSAHAQNEIQRARGTPLEADQALAKFARLEDRAAGYFESKAFRMAGDTSDQVKKIIQTELQNAVKSGRPLPEVRAQIWDRLVAMGLTRREAARGIETDDAVNAALDALWVDSEAQATAYLNTLVRTNVFESLNEARYQEFTDPALGDFVQAFEYAAVMDSSTTDICRELEGKIFAKDSPEWDEYRPPNHFNCRSVLIPITIVDDWNGKESASPTIDPAKGFK